MADPCALIQLRKLSVRAPTPRNARKTAMNRGDKAISCLIGTSSALASPFWRTGIGKAVVPNHIF